MKVFLGGGDEGGDAVLEGVGVCGAVMLVARLLRLIETPLLGSLKTLRAMQLLVFRSFCCKLVDKYLCINFSF